MTWFSDGDGVDYRHETPFSFRSEIVEERQYVGPRRADYIYGPLVHAGADTPMQALMQAAPNTEPVITTMDTIGLRDRICDAIDTLDERKRYVFDAIASGRRSMKQLAGDMSLSKSMVHKLYTQARAQLRAHLEAA